MARGDVSVPIIHENDGIREEDTEMTDAADYAFLF